MRKVYKFLFIALIWQFEIATAQDSKTIVFVCEHGAARSTIASMYFNKLAKENGLPYRSVFRAISSDTSLTKETKKGLTGDGFSIKNLKPKDLAPTDITKNTILISLDCSVPTTYGTKDEWKGIPPISSDYQTARNEILKRVNELIAELKQKK